MEVAVADIGGTHARFAIAKVEKGKIVALTEPITFKTAECPSLEAAWAIFAANVGRPLPVYAAIAVACPVAGDEIRLTNSSWVIKTSHLRSDLGLEHCFVLNDFGAVAHAVSEFRCDGLQHLHGPEVPLPEQGVVCIVGPGTGLGVACLMREPGRDRVVECEGGHVGFAPQDPTEDRINGLLRRKYGRVSAERVLSGRGLANLYEALGELDGHLFSVHDEKALWTAAIEGCDPLAVTALDRFCRCLGSVAGDLALAQGANAVVIAGGLGRKLAKILPQSSFGAHFTDKGRFAGLMAQIPVKLIVHPEPGLFGAAAAFLRIKGANLTN